jgi:periplasmic copper chaperone A
MKKKQLLLAIAFISLFGSNSAWSHITLEPAKVFTGDIHKTILRVGRACSANGSTTALTVRIPDGMINPKPMPKSGWSLTVKKIDLEQPLVLMGRTMTQAAQEVTWTATSKEAAIHDDHYEEFVVRGRLPAKAGVLWWKSIQSCGDIKMEWAETPTEGISTVGLKSPASPLEVLPRPDASAHGSHR